MKKLEDYVVTIPDFPEPGIMFRDITSVIQDPDGLKLAVDGLADLVRDLDFDLVIGPESRGFIFGVPVAYLLGKGFIPVRKKGKLPRETVSQKYDLEYGQAEIEIHKDAVCPGQKVVVVDDLIATGGSAEAPDGHRRKRGSRRQARGETGRTGCENGFRDGTCRTGRTEETERIRCGIPDCVSREISEQKQRTDCETSQSVLQWEKRERGGGLFELKRVHDAVNSLPGSFPVRGDEKIELDLVAAVQPGVDPVVSLAALPRDIGHFHAAEDNSSRFGFIPGEYLKGVRQEPSGIRYIDGKGNVLILQQEAKIRITGIIKGDNGPGVGHGHGQMRIRAGNDLG